MMYEHAIAPRGGLTAYLRDIVDEEGWEREVMEVTGVQVCKVSENFGVSKWAILYNSVTSLRGQRLCPGKRWPG
jgi:hypothetical protein